MRGKDIFEIMNDFSRLGFVLEVKSNGMLLKQSAIDKFANLNLLNLQISIYDTDHHFSDCEEYYSFSRLLENIQLAIKQGIPLSLSVLVGKHNIDDLDKYHDTFAESGVVIEIFIVPTLLLNAMEEKEKTISSFEKRDG